MEFGKEIPIAGFADGFLDFGSGRSVESGGVPSGEYRQPHRRGWGGSEMPCAFEALQLQRLRTRIF